MSSKFGTIGQWIWSIITMSSILGIIYVTVLGFQWMTTQHKPDIEPPRKKAVPVEVLQVKQRMIVNKKFFNATVKADFEVALQPKIAGRLTSITLASGKEITEGLYLKKGDVVATLDSQKMAANVRFEQSVLESIKSNVELARVNLDEMKREMERQDRLMKTGAGMQQDYEKSVTNYERAIAQLRQSINQVMQQRAALEKSKVELDYTNIYAPQDGVVTRKRLHPGSYVTTSTAILEMMSIDTVKINIQVPQNMLPNLAENQTKVMLSSENWPNAYEAIVTKIFPAIDPVTRTCTVQIKLHNVREADGTYRYRPGMYLTVSLILDVKDKAFVVPLDLPIRNMGRYYVFKLMPDQTVKSVEVILGIREDEFVEVVSGISEDDWIVSNGQFRLTDGASVTRIGGQQKGNK